MKTKTKRPIRFDYFWNGLVHLDDGSEWSLADFSRRRDVIWWQTGEAVKLDRARGRTLLRNLVRDETVPLAPTEAAEWNLAA